MIEEDVKELISAPNAVLKTQILEARSEPPYHNYVTAGRGVPSTIADEMYKWRHQFIGRSALEFKHCVLTINIRRNHELQINLDAFFQAWAEEAYFLTKALDLKWLVSACDTFADHSGDDTERATALIGATLFKTIKIYETERLYRYKRLEPAEWPEYKLVPLFDGLKSFNIGYGDAVINLKRRIKNLVRRGTTASLMLDELFDRACKLDTAFSRWRAEHFNERTSW
jgi:hypothetical protein